MYRAHATVFGTPLGFGNTATPHRKTLAVVLHPRPLVRLRTLILCLLTLLVSGRALADGGADAAQLLYEEALALMAEQQFDEACGKLERSLATDEAMGARFSLAECYEAQGKLASAWRNYTTVADQASAAGRQDRAAYARDRATKVRPHLATIKITLSPEVIALEPEVKRNGHLIAAELVGTPIPIDPGSHRISLRAKGHQVHLQHVQIDHAEAASLHIAELRPVIATPSQTAPSQTGAQRSSDALLITSIVVGASGVVAMGVGAGVAIAAKQRYDEATEQHCVDLRCSPQGVSETEDARDQGTLASAVFGIGAALASVGLTLLIVDVVAGDDDADSVTVSASPTLGGAVIQGTF